MKGIILAGGLGTRLYPLTKHTSKQLLPVYDKPMICYPLATLMLLGIKEVLIISTPRDLPNIETFLGNGHELGINISYKEQKEPKGIAEAFVIGEEFIDNEPVCLILGDNIFYANNIVEILEPCTKINDGAAIVGYYVTDPERFGVIEFDKDLKVISLEEKPEKPKSNFAAVGLYFYDKNVVKYTKELKPSARGELEITDLNKVYLNKNKLESTILHRGTAWLDAGTPDSLLDASIFIGMTARRQGLKLACLEEIAYRMNFINDEQMQKVIDNTPTGSDYKTYLQRVMKETK